MKKKYDLEFCEHAADCKNYCPYICDEHCEYIRYSNDNLPIIK